MPPTPFGRNPPVPAPPPCGLRRSSRSHDRPTRIPACSHTRIPWSPSVTCGFLPGLSVREVCNQMPNPSISAPLPRSYRLRRHFPRHCDVTTRVLHPYKPRFLRKRRSTTPPCGCRAASGVHPAPADSHPPHSSPVRDSILHHWIYAQDTPLPAPFHGLAPSKSGLVYRESASSAVHKYGTASGTRQKTDFRIPDCSGIRKYYQLAFVTPGIKPFEAISRNWIRLMPNRRI